MGSDYKAFVPQSFRGSDVPPKIDLGGNDVRTPRALELYAMEGCDGEKSFPEGAASEC